ncbi:Asp-tRNA(Asn)/Glu-tRNA(Gln) amidotransferase subunit GatB [Spiroplasma endosymbiont of Anurida maritima]|uniref:Asp-tRNA(Asn)/Glu-tRNA(Gln) amidotransferase subunit GatB n=1 Tax=Spiroplasma endosymbiont of Anurida maritima TaxID=2967972 RepID=UPI0036D35B36
MNFEVIIGIENHIELKTKTKMFSPGKVNFNDPQNTNVHYTDIGWPGTMPTVNKKGVELAIKASAALGMKIDNKLIFDRKNYFYPDLPKGFQITQFYHPIGRDGKLEIMDLKKELKTITIERIHIEEDTAKQIHANNKTYLDYNRAGVGLIEVVTDPVFRNAHEVKEYIKLLREILLYTDVSDAKMNEGSLRCDVNISLRPIGSNLLFNRIEVKNLNSLNNIEKAIEFEIKRQSEILLKGQFIQMETRRFDEKTQKTILMRKKSDATDYKYFTESNIAPIKLEQKFINNIVDNLPELPQEKKLRFMKDYGLKIEEVNLILASKSLAEFFEETTKTTLKHDLIVNYILGDILVVLNKKNIDINSTFLTPKKLGKLIVFQTEGIISSKQAKSVIKYMFEEDLTPSDIIDKYNLKQISDATEIQKLLEPIFNNNLKILNDFETRPERVQKFFMGELMKLTKGQVNPVVGNKVINELIEKNINK